ncbi:MAG: restriction endonuclease [Synechococcus sp. SB0676_bin_10]|uniref:Restriction endonuclease n=1 Tax=Synechococcus sp. SB0676_bin_10 TaxID=2604869 RepID=A0A6B1F8A3_9SYNE|nr:restriction endonuclease [Synechococcus sp. SB0676_bin_10]
MKNFILNALAGVQNGYSLCGVVDRRARIYPLGSDTKVISTLFEIVARQAVMAYAKSVGLQLVEPTKQNYYPDFTLMRNEKEQEKIAIAVKTTYREEKKSQFNYTLGSYTSYIRTNEKKNIVFPYSQYGEHWIIGFVYKRSGGKRDMSDRIYSFETLNQIPIPFDDVEVFMQEKWRIAGDRAGSGNTANIGSIDGTITEFSAGNGVFNSEEEFLEYWRGYKRTERERRSSYSNIHEFRSKRRT